MLLTPEAARLIMSDPIKQTKSEAGIQDSEVITVAPSIDNLVRLSSNLFLFAFLDKYSRKVDEIVSA